MMDSQILSIKNLAGAVKRVKMSFGNVWTVVMGGCYDARHAWWPPMLVILCIVLKYGYIFLCDSLLMSSRNGMDVVSRNHLFVLQDFASNLDMEVPSAFRLHLDQQNLLSPTLQVSIALQSIFVIAARMEPFLVTSSFYEQAGFLLPSFVLRQSLHSNVSTSIMN
jgi:hypothetical protein